MYANNTRDLEGLGRPDASPNNHAWTALRPLERDLLIATACLQRTNHPTTTNQLKTALESWYTDLSYGDLYGALEILTATGLLESIPTATDDYHLTPAGQTLLETYRDHLTQILQPQTITLTLERPLTPGDLEQIHSQLEEAVHR